MTDEAKEISVYADPEKLIKSRAVLMFRDGTEPVSDGAVIDEALQYFLENHEINESDGTKIDPVPTEPSMFNSQPAFDTDRRAPLEPEFQEPYSNPLGDRMQRAENRVTNDQAGDGDG